MARIPSKGLIRLRIRIRINHGKVSVVMKSKLMVASLNTRLLKNPGSMAEHIAKRCWEIDKISSIKVGDQEIPKDTKYSMDDLIKAIKSVTTREEGKFTIIGEGDKPLTIEGVEQSKIKEKIGEEIEKVTNEIIGGMEDRNVEVKGANGEIITKPLMERNGELLRKYSDACNLSTSLGAKDSLHAKITKPIHIGEPAAWKDWKELHAVVGEDGKLKFAGSQFNSEEISLKDAKQRLEKLVEKKELPIKIGELIGNELEDKIREGLGVSKEDWDDQKGKGGIKYCFNPPKYVFKCIDSNGRETYYFTNDKKVPGKKEGIKKATKVKLDSEALRVLEESMSQGNLKIINLKDIYMFKKGENGGKWYITNNENFGKTPYGASYCPDMGQQIHDFKTEWDSDDLDKKSWWRSIFNWGGDKSENKDRKYDEDGDDDNYRDKYRYGYGSNDPYSPYAPYAPYTPS